MKVQGVYSNFSPLGMTAVAGISSRRKYSSVANMQSTLPLQFDLPHFIVESEIV